MVQLIDKSLQNSNALQNIGLIDRMVRIIVGSAMISTWFFYPVESVSLWFAALPLLGVLPLLSGILGWCPTYAMFHTKSCGTDEHNSCGTIPDQVEHMIHPH
jgi:Inner membrane protein YgaP-like, transmembrane domain